MPVPDTTPKPDDNKPPVDDKSGKDDKGGDSKTFTQDQLNEVVSKRLAEEKSKQEEATKKAIAEALAEADRKAKLSAEEKAKEESEKRENEIAQKERDLSIRENRATAREALQERGISADLVEYVVDVDADKTQENIDKFEAAWNKAVSEAVDKKLAGKTPTEKEAPNKNDGEKASTHDLLYKKK